MSAFFHAVYDTIDYYRKYYKATNELMNLTDRELEDLGISRGEIHFVVSKSLNKWAI